MSEDPTTRPSELADEVIVDVRDDVERAVDEIASTGIGEIERLEVLLMVAIRERLPVYGQGWSRAIAEDLSVSVNRTAALLLDCVRHDHPPARQDLLSLTMAALQRGRDGIDRRDVHNAMEVCKQVGFTFLMRECTPTKIPSRVVASAAATIAERLERHLTALRHAIDDGFDEAENQPGHSGRTRGEAAIANRLLSGRWRKESEIRQAADTLGKTLGRCHGVVVVSAATKTSEPPIATAAGRFGDDLPVTVLQEATRWNPIPHVPIVVSMPSQEKWRQLVQSDGTLAGAATAHALVAVVSGPVETLSALPERYRRIQRDLGYLRAARTDAGSVSARRLEMFALWGVDGTDIGHLTAFVRQVFDEVEREANADLLFAILDAFCRQSGPSRWGDIASAVHVHRNNVMHKVRKIERLTGLSFDSVADVHELVTAYRLREFVRGELDKLDSFD